MPRSQGLRFKRLRDWEGNPRIILVDVPAPTGQWYSERLYGGHLPVLLLTPPPAKRPTGSLARRLHARRLARKGKRPIYAT